MINYLEYDQWGLTKVMCMHCGCVVAKRESIDGRFVLIHQSHSKRFRVVLQDNSIADLIVCTDCVNAISNSDLVDLEATMRWGWQREVEWKLNESAKSEDKAAFGLIKDELSLPVETSVVDTATAFLKSLADNKGIVKRGS